MKNPAKLFCLFILLAAPCKAFALGSVTILADSNLSMIVSQLARDYGRERNIIVNSSFAASSAQEVQISEGSSADILITSKQSWIDDLKTKGLIDIYSQAVIARDQLVLAGPTDSTVEAHLERFFPVADVIRALGDDASFVVANPETLPEGGVSKEAMRGSGASDYLEPNTIYLKQRPEMLALVKDHGAYGIFLYSVAQNRDGIRVIDIFPQSLHKPAYYYAVAIAGENMDEARRFIEYLQSRRAHKILEQQGFLID